MAGSLPGDAKRDSDLIPAAPAGAGRRDTLGDQGLIPANFVGSFGNGTQIRQVLCRRGSRVQVLRQLLEAAGRFRDLRIRVSH